MAIRIVPLILSALLMAAHFLREGHLTLVGVSLLAPALLFVRRRWSLVSVQVLAYVGAGIWVYTASVLVGQRMAAGMPWIRMGLILGGVALFTAVSGLLLNGRLVRECYGAGGSNRTREEDGILRE